MGQQLLPGSYEWLQRVGGVMKGNDGLLMKYFVLKPSGNDVYAKASRYAMSIYAMAIEQENPVLARDLRNWIKSERNIHKFTLFKIAHTALQLNGRVGRCKKKGSLRCSG